jgi:hypothetical protein
MSFSDQRWRVEYQGKWRTSKWSSLELFEQVKVLDDPFLQTHWSNKGSGEIKRSTKRIQSAAKKVWKSYEKWWQYWEIAQTRLELKTMKDVIKEHIPIFFIQTTCSLWNVKSKKMIDPYQWLMNYLNCKVDAKGTYPHLRNLVNLFCKVYKKDLEVKRPLIKKKRRWLSLAVKRQITKWSCKLHRTASGPWIKGATSEFKKQVSIKY